MPHVVRIASAIALSITLSTPALAQLPTLPSDGLQQPAASSSITDGAPALSVNPAGIGFTQGFTLRYLHQEGPRLQSVTQDGDGLYLAARIFGFLGLGVSWEWMRQRSESVEAGLDPDDPSADLITFGGFAGWRRTTWGLSLGGDAASLGGSVHLFSSDDLGALDDLVTYDLGLIGRPARWLSLAFQVRNVGGGELESTEITSGDFTLSTRAQPIPRSYIGSIGLRPLGDWLTLAIDGTVLGSENDEIDAGFDEMQLAYVARAQVVPGLTLLGSFGHDVDGGAWQTFAGLGVDFDHLGLSGGPAFVEDGDDPGSLVALDLRTRPTDGLDLRPARVAKIDLDGELARPGGFQLFPGQAREPMVDVIEGLHRYARDPDVDAVLLEYEGLPGVGMGEAFEIRQAMFEFRRSGKKLVVLLSGGEDTEYYVASAADAIWSTPEAAYLINGLASSVNFYAETLEMIGVDVEAVRVGAYKNAPDQFTRSEISEEHRRVQEELLDDVFGRYVASVAEARKITPERYREILSTGIQSAQLARELGLVDRVLYPDEVEDAADELLGRGARVEDARLRPEPWDSWGHPPVVAVIPIDGLIAAGQSSDNPFMPTAGAESIVSAIERASKDRQVRAIVLRVDSGGGDAGGSQLIWRALLEAKKRKPVVASIGDIAASGGYYAAVACDRIVAPPTSITGSIGIFWIKPSFEKLLGFLEVKTYRTSRGDLADITSYVTPWTEAEKAAMQKYVDTAYQQFLEATAKGRALSTEQVHEVAQGRVWTGAQAHERKLVDELGGLSDALAIARRLSGLDAEEAVDYRVYRPGVGLFGLGAGGLASLAKVELPEPLAAALREGLPPPLLVPNRSGLWALGPWGIEIR